jgi:hypothetical protein
MRNEPVLTIAGVQAAVAAVLSLLVAFGVELTQEQTVAVLGVCGTVLPILFAIWARGKVTPS